MPPIDGERLRILSVARIEDAGESYGHAQGTAAMQSEGPAALQIESGAAGHSTRYTQSDQCGREDDAHSAADSRHAERHKHPDEGDTEGIKSKQETDLEGIGTGSDLSDIYWYADVYQAAA
ncbi:hypothetical protein FN846DRAFT_889649 [Sphaerosporella brunnea]|uniref:Uncharacterized protein n=1 Tax=Sphaerosporella brunnea TaxID=1250544 RepID=A0A5J5EZ82_9PEZI|nr:hypothetical protein FN846DRAFT_889649 [Sphaerosporella brunnea]